MTSTPETAPPSRRVPEGFPHQLDDSELERAITEFADELRETTQRHGVGLVNQGIVLGYGTLLDVGRAEQFRRQLRRSEKLARLALVVAIASSLVTTAFSVLTVFFR